ncbi:DBR1 [Branchiostoma lanceolatum]|uniref:DBR1 protein n=1 Tax=Branchiostoma lanceolatum TaxID=7740 RepID=A0A8K0EE18_BRALA|nr:DBR1 [Branchiostoma lanceolatum]
MKIAVEGCAHGALEEIYGTRQYVSAAMKIAVEGCAHGALEEIYGTLQYLEQQEGIKVELLLCCGDFQAVRNADDLECMAVPKKFRFMESFHKYYSGEKKAPYLTIFIGGNHEASNYLAELPYGGWVAPNIYYLGYAGVVNVGGIRIGGVSGIYKSHDYRKGHYEAPPYNENNKRSAYHIRSLEVFRMKQLKRPIDIMMSHDWPRGVYHCGNTKELLAKKSFFRDEIESNTLGSPPAEELLRALKPSYWFSGHLHCKFVAAIEHEKEGQETPKVTKFLALDKCLPRRDFLQVIDVPRNEFEPLELQYDAEWLAVLQGTNHLFSTSKVPMNMPSQFTDDRWDYSVSAEEMEGVKKAFNGDLKVPDNFVQTAPTFNPSQMRNTRQPNLTINPQTTLLCGKLGVTDPCKKLLKVAEGNPDEIDLDEDDDEDDTRNPEEISTSDVDDADADDDDSAAEEVIVPVNPNITEPMPSQEEASISDEEAELIKEMHRIRSSPATSQDDSSDILTSPFHTGSETESAAPDLSDSDSLHQGKTDSDSGKRSSENETDGSGSKKKFKRRNQAMYEDTEESC